MSQSTICSPFGSMHQFHVLRPTYAGWIDLYQFNELNNFAEKFMASKKYMIVARTYFELKTPDVTCACSLIFPAHA